MGTRKEASETAAGGRRRLGRGLSGLISSAVSITLPQDRESRDSAVGPGTDPRADVPRGTTPEATGIRLIRAADIRPDPRQPRQRFDEAALDALAASIRAAGLMQPIVVRPGVGGGYRIVVGERRWRATRKLGLEHVPAIVRDLDDRAAMEWALIENIQREDLNPMERADAFKGLTEQHGLTHQEVADRVGLDRTSITNLLRLHELDDYCKEAVRNGHVTAAAAKVLLAVGSADARQQLARQLIREGWSVRTLQGRARAFLGPKSQEAKPAAGGPPAEGDAPRLHRKDLERRLSDHLGTRVRIDAGRKKGTGRVIIEYYSLDQFDGLMDRLGFRST
jgi:ParB family chromosome partitioning protein